MLFSHSSSFAVNPHPRNVPDDVLAKLPANGGVIHVNFIKEFISTKNQAWQDRRSEAVRKLHLEESTDEAITKDMEEWDKNNPFPRPTISDVADHIDHIRQVAGVDHIGIGADYYDVGGESMAQGLEDVTRYPYLFAELLRRKYSDEDALKIAGKKSSARHAADGNRRIATAEIGDAARGADAIEHRGPQRLKARSFGTLRPA